MSLGMLILQDDVAGQPSVLSFPLPHRRVLDPGCSR